MQTSVPALAVRGLRKSFGSLRAVDDVSFNVPQGAVVALIGPNGAGKSTLFNLVAGVIAPDAGSVEMFGSRIDGMRAHQRARIGLGRTFQAAIAFPNMSVIENVMVSMRHLARTGIVAHALGSRRARNEEAEMRAHAHHCLETVGLLLGEGVTASALTAGQQRLLAVARVVAAHPRILLLDEPAAGLNDSERAHLARTVHHLQATGMTVLLIEHAMDFVMSIAEQVVVLDYGKKLAEGPPDRIRNDPEVIAAYFGVE